MDGGFLEQTPLLEGAQHAALHGALDLLRVLEGEQAGLVEAWDTGAGRLLAEEAVQGQDVEVEWGLRELPKRWGKETAASPWANWRATFDPGVG